MIKKRFLIFALLFSLLSNSIAATQVNSVQKNSIWALVELSSGSVLMNDNQKKRINPGDLVSLMTLYTGLKIAQRNNISLDKKILFNSNDAQTSQSLRRIYLVPNTQTELKTLFHAIAVIGAEDASLAISRALSGNHIDFIKEMNSYAKRLGMNDSKFSSPINHKDQISSAYDMVLLTISLYREFPDVAKWFNEKEFIFSGLKQRNRNLALWKNNEINGVMSNYDCTDLIISWSKTFNDNSVQRQRLLLSIVLNGEDSEKTINDALTLIRIGRMDFDVIKLFDSDAVIARLEVMKGARDKVEVGSPIPICVSLERKNLMNRGTGGISTRIEYLSPLTAPIKKGDVLGSLQIEFEGEKVTTYPIYALHDVGEGGFFSRYVDSVRINMNKSQIQKEKR